MEALIDILLATYNGERFLRPQLDSLLAQTEQGFRILARDDGSSDGTIAVLGEFAKAHPGRLAAVGTRGPGLGACGNFAALAALSTAPYVMFCDHDDVWHPDKVAASLGEMRRLEAEHGPQTPILVHADLRVVDERLEEISPRMSLYQGVDIRRGSDFPHLLVQNTATGCTLMANRALVEAALPVPPGAILHDHWFALVAAACGRVSLIDRPLIDYRQHAGNAVGAAGMGLMLIWKRFREGSARYRRSYLAICAQAEAFGARYGDRLPVDRREACLALASLPRSGWWQRRRSIIRHRLWKSGWTRNLAWMMLV
jgi:glycosyltransferase involved in cell wall biosynthesis